MKDQIKSLGQLILALLVITLFWYVASRLYWGEWPKMW